VLDVVKIYGPIILLVAIGFVAAYQFVDPAPPRHLTLATGPEDGAYHAFGQRYREILGREGIEVKLLTTRGSVENLKRLAAGAANQGTDGGPADLAFVQSGVGSPSGYPGLMALGSLYYEPLWVFSRGSTAPDRLSDLVGRRLAVGEEGSGTRYVVLQLLAANGIGEDDGTVLEALGGSAAAAALQTGLVDAAFFVTARLEGAVGELLEQQGIALMSFARAAAYERRFAHLAAVDLPEGVLDLASDLPARDMTLVSPLATMVAREDLHPALVDLVMKAAAEIHGPAGLFERADAFPSPKNVDFPLSSDAARFYKSGQSFLRRVLPFWVATFIERTWILILPILTLMIPLMRVGPPAYRWQVRRRIYRWYGDLRKLEAQLQDHGALPDAAARKAALAELNALQDEVGQLAVPLSYADNLYHLRLHIDFVRARYSEFTNSL